MWPTRSACGSVAMRLTRTWIGVQCLWGHPKLCSRPGSWFCDAAVMWLRLAPALPSRSGHMFMKMPAASVPRFLTKGNEPLFRRLHWLEKPDVVEPWQRPPFHILFQFFVLGPGRDVASASSSERLRTVTQCFFKVVG